METVAAPAPAAEEAPKEAAVAATTTSMEVDSTSTPKNGGDESKKVDDTTTNMEVDTTTTTTTEEDKAAATTTTPSSSKKRRRKSSHGLEIDPLGLPKSVKRERKSVEIFETNFKTEGRKSLEGAGGMVKGRGKKLMDIPSVRDSIKASKMKGPDLAAAHNLVFGGRGKDRLKKSQLLEFSGYLPFEQDTDKVKQKEIDEALEKKYGMKANKLTMPVLKRICDLFDVDRSVSGDEKCDKDFLVDRLLDFLAVPADNQTKAYLKESNKKAAAKKKAAATKNKKETPTKKKQTPTKKGRKSKSPGRKKKKVVEEEISSDEEMSSEEDESEEEEDAPPSDKALQKWVKAYVRCFSHDKATPKHAVETATDKFGVDMSSQKARIKELLKEAVTGKKKATPAKKTKSPTAKKSDDNDDDAAVASPKEKEEKTPSKEEEEKTADAPAPAKEEDEKPTTDDAPKKEEETKTADTASKEEEKAADTPAATATTTSEDKPEQEI